eukprot:TRINITY_DN13513_c0_g1_i1.p1 TRINITY_DN13513_c0_g1~~TRINITY_DN13513_c0_g1_i1.p1  ORF type:complete len:349 (+),score=46.16 TRINITY_DN13513_c0_g1_i1:101-1147(+)
MRHFLAATAALLTTTTLATAGGIDRSGQFIGPLFEEGGETGSYMQLSFGLVQPEANSDDSSDPLEDYVSLGFAYKADLNDQMSFALIIDEPYGVNVEYTDGIFAGGQAHIDSTGVAGILRYRINENFSVHGGARLLKAEGNIVSSSGILDASSDWSTGYLIGAAYERPDIALRVAVTYNSAIESTFEGTEIPSAPSGGRTFELEWPESVNVEFQTGVAQDTLVFGSIRYAMWDGFSLDTPQGNYVNFTEDTTAYSVGVGRRINDQLALSASVGYESPGDRPSNTALAPTTGSTTVTLAATYTVDNMSLTSGVTFGKLGDQDVPTGPTTVESFEDNTVLGFGVRMGVNF